MKDSTHVVCTESGFKCVHCGQASSVRFPISVSDWIALSRAFVKEHIDCKAKG